MRQRIAHRIIVAAAALLAALTARPYAGSWNDGSRLATVESLVERRTFQIDESIYVHPPTAALPPFDARVDSLGQFGTQDKLFVKGHYYSDKSPLPAVFMAGTFQVGRWLGLPAAIDRPDLLARLVTVLFAGLPYVLAVYGIGRVARRLDLAPPWDVVLTASFAFGSLATPYVQHVNNHILLLAVAVGICAAIFRPAPVSAGRALWIGVLAGVGYTIDLGVGPLLTSAVAGYLVWQRRGLVPFVLGALPWIVAHHALNYGLFGTLGPANARPENFQWPGSPFHAGNLTGSWQHPSAGRAIVYAGELWFGKKGFLLYSLPMLQVVAGAYWLMRRRYPERAALVAMAVWAVATWMLCAATSRNQSGLCLSIRWFLPFLAPGYVALIVLARDYRLLHRPLLVLILGALVLNIELLLRGPWWGRVPTLLWPVAGVAVAAWLTLLAGELRRRRQKLLPSAKPVA